MTQDQETRTETGVQVKPHRGVDVSALLAVGEADLPGWRRGDGTVYAYWETPTACHLKALAPGTGCFPQDAWGGRLFGPGGELRWVRTGDTLDGWTTREVSLDTDEAPQGVTRITVLPRRYYLLGEWGNGRFYEQRYPKKRDGFEYPLDGEHRDQDRAWILVHEHRPARPDPDALAASDGNIVERIEQALNQPAVIGHRFVSVGVGRDS